MSRKINFSRKHLTREGSKLSLLFKAFFLGADYKWLLLIGYFFFLDFGQEMYEQGSMERVDFFHINLAAWFLIFSLYMWKDGPKLMPTVSHKVFKAISFYFAWDLWDNIYNQGYRIYQQDALNFSMGIFIFLSINFVWQYFSKRDFTLLNEIAFYVRHL